MCPRYRTLLHRSVSVQHHRYADDTQLYTAVRSGGDVESINRLEQYSLAVRNWFLANGILLNPDKSEVLLVGTHAQAQKLDGGASLAVAGANITYSSELKSLGVTLDTGLTFNQHVRSIVKPSNFRTSALRHIRTM